MLFNFFLELAELPLCIGSGSYVLNMIQPNLSTPIGPCIILETETLPDTIFHSQLFIIATCNPIR